MGVFNPQRLARGDIQQQAFDRREDDPEAVKRLNKFRPNWRDELRLESPVGKYGQLEDEQQADALKSAAQRPEADSIENNGQPEAPSRFKTNSDLFPESVLNQYRGERNIYEAEMKPANITPGAKPVGKGGTIVDSDMNVGAAGSAINAQVNDRKYSGRLEFKRARFYGR